MQFGGKNVFVKIFAPPCVAFSRRLRVTLKFFLKLVEAVTAMNFYWAIYTVEKAPNVPIFLMDYYVEVHHLGEPPATRP